MSKELDYTLEEFYEGIKKENAKIITAFYRKYWKGVYLTARKRYSCPERAADATQDTFLLLFDKTRKDEIQNPNAIISFMHSTVSNKLSAEQRKEIRRATDSTDNMDLLAEHINLSPLAEIHHEQTSKIIKSIINEFSTERDRNVIEEFYLHDFSKKQICRHQNLDGNHFDKVIFRARTRLREKFEEHNLTFKDLHISGAILCLLLVITFYLYGESQSTLNKKISNSVRECPTTTHYTDRSASFRLSPAVYLCVKEEA